MLATLFSIVLVAVAQQPTIYWSRCVPTETRTVWLYGENLHKGSEYQGIDAASINGVPLGWDNNIGANGNDANRGLSYLQRFSIPSVIDPGTHQLDFVRNDGSKASAQVIVPQALRLRSFVEAGPVVEVDAPVIVTGTQDFGGKTFVPAASFTPGDASAVVVLLNGSRASNFRVVIPETFPRTIRQAVLLRGVWHTLDGVEVINRQRGGYGVFVDDAQKSTFHHVHVEAARTWENFPNDQCESCTWIGCTNTGPRGRWDGQVGRGMGGRNHLVAWTKFADMDRTLTASPWGSPLDRSVWFECHTQRTGVSVGASEGCLIECMECLTTNAIVDGRMVRFTTQPGADVRHLKPGNHVAAIPHKSFARIVSIVSRDQDRTIELDVPLPAGAYEIRVGNMAVENAFIRCSFADGKSGIWFFGASARNRVIQCDFSGMREACIETIKRKDAKVHAFSWDLIIRDCTQHGTAPLLMERQ